jgi:hypothetical protein
MKTIAVLGAALAISLTFAETASAQAFGGGDSVSVTQTSTDAFGNRQSVTKRRNADGSASISKSTTDAFGNRQSVTKRRNADGSESISITKGNIGTFGNLPSVNRRNTF